MAQTKYVRLDKPLDFKIIEMLENLEQESGLSMDGTQPLLGLWDGKEIVGAVWIEDPKLGGIWNVAVLPKYRGSGYGTKLIAELHKLAKKLRYKFLQCDPINPMVGKLVVNKYHYKPYDQDWRLYLT